jgi:tetratricopeptide (TPR) repeat protein
VIDEAGAGLSVTCPACSRDLIVPTPERESVDALPPSTSSDVSDTTAMATEKQEAFLRDLGIPFTSGQLTREEALDLIDDALSGRPPTERQKDKLRRLGLVDQLEEDDTAADASAVLEDALLSSPTENQCVRTKELGFTISDEADFNAGELDEILKLADRQPDSAMLNALAELGVKWSSGTALDARMILDLAFAYGTGAWRWEMASPEHVAKACAAATKDPAFYEATIDNRSMGFQYFYWPETKMREWAGSVGSRVELYERATKLKPDDAHSWSELGNAYSEVKRYNDAIAAYHQAIDLSPNAFLPHLGLAAAYHKSGQPRPAEDAFSEAQRLNSQLFNRFIESAKGSKLLAEMQKQYPALFD